MELLRKDKMPIVNESDIGDQNLHPVIHHILNSNPNGIVHNHIGTIFITKNEWLLHFFEQLESLIDSTLARRLAHSSFIGANLTTQIGYLNEGFLEALAQ